MKVNVDTVKSLIARHANDGEMIDLIVDCLESFESYHKAIYSLEIQRELYTRGAMDSETYRELVPHLDQIRSSGHNAVISNVRLLNRLAQQAGLKPFYDDIVSEEHPYRTELADAILEYVNEVIVCRVKGK